MARSALPTGGGGCAAHVPPRCKGRTKCQCECHAGIPAAMSASSTKIVAKTAPELENLAKMCENLIKMVPRPSKIELWGLQNRAWSPPRRHFLRTLNLRRFQRAYIKVFWGQTSQLGSILEAQDPPKSRPRGEKTDVEKQQIFDIDFGRVQAWFWKSF